MQRSVRRLPNEICGEGNVNAVNARMSCNLPTPKERIRLAASRKPRVWSGAGVTLNLVPNRAKLRRAVPNGTNGSNGFFFFFFCRHACVPRRKTPFYVKALTVVELGVNWPRPRRGSGRGGGVTASSGYMQ